MWQRTSEPLRRGMRTPPSPFVPKWLHSHWSARALRRVLWTRVDLRTSAVLFSEENWRWRERRVSGIRRRRLDRGAAAGVAAGLRVRDSMRLADGAERGERKRLL